MKLFEDCINAMPDALLLVALDGSLLYANGQARQLWGLNGDEISGRPLVELVVEPAERVNACLQLWRRTTSPVPCVLTFLGGEGADAVRVDGARLRSTCGEDEAILLRCRPRPQTTSQFRVLTEKIDALAHEVGYRRRVERELAQQREWLHITLGSIGDGVIATDDQLRVTLLNDVAAELTGWDAEVAEGRPVDEVFRIVDERTGEPAVNPCATVLREKRAVELANHTALIRRDETTVAIEDTAAPIRDSNGDIRGVVLVFHDVTEKRRAEDALRQQREWFQTTLASIGDAVIATDTEGRITFMNPVAERLTGWPLDEARNKPSTKVFDIINESTRKLVESPVSRVLREGVIAGLANHTVLRSRTGHEYPIDDSGAPIRSPTGEMIGVVLVFHDISHRKAAQDALRESEARFRLLADAAPVVVWLTDEAGAVTYLNREWSRLTGDPATEHLGDAWRNAIHPDDRDRVDGTYRQAFEQQEPFRLEYRLARHDGTYRWMLATAVPRYLEDERFAGYVGSAIDITERRQAEAQLVSINDLLERRVAERTRQLRRLASELTHTEQRERRRLAQTLHDHLQQLLAAAKMRIDILRRQCDEKQAPSMEQVNALLDQSIEASRSLTVELSPPILYDAGLAPAIPWLARRMRTQHDLNVATKVDPHAEPNDEDVRLLLFEAVRELLFNTVKHAGTDHASVRLDLADAETIRVVVRDEGRGFDPAKLDDAAAEHGFGLFNIRERLELLGGRVTLDSVVGEGTRVEITVPLKQEPESDPAGRTAETHPSDALGVEHARSGRHVRVLLVDDHKIVREGLVSLLSAQPGVEVVGEASDGREAVELTRQLRPDVVVMDVSMPRMNGVEATRLICRQFPDTRIIGLSMHQEAELGDALRNAGAVAYMAKDGPVGNLVDVIRGKQPPGGGCGGEGEA